MLRNIQTLRFLAAMWVVFHHMTPPVIPYDATLLPSIISKLGFAGVDVFFVISGIIMAETTRNLNSGYTTSKQFILQRFGRIYIGWWPFFFIYLVFLKSLGALSPTVSIPGSFFLWPQDLTQYLLSITWTLSFELYFYLLTAVIVFWNRHHAKKILCIFGAIIITANVAFYLNGMYLPENEFRSKKFLIAPFFLSPLILEFISGFLLAEFIHKQKNQKIIPWIIGSIVTITTAHLYQTYGNLNPSGMAGFYHANERVILLGSFSLCICALALNLEKNGITPFKILQYLGDTSYSIYLAHIIFIASINMAYFKYQAKLQITGNTWWLITISAILVYSLLHFIYIEKPAHQILKKIISKYFNRPAFQQ